MVMLWMAFAGLLYWCEAGVTNSPISSFGRALYWGVAAFSTAGIADMPVSGAAMAVGGIWIVIGSMVFFGSLVATVTAYFMRPMQRPVHQIIDTVEYNLERLDDLTVEELELLRETIDTLIEHVEAAKNGSRSPQ